MNPYLYSFLALDIARQRAEEAERSWLESTIRAGKPSRATLLRRHAARVLASVSRASASVVRRLDSCTADDLGRALAPTE